MKNHVIILALTSIVISLACNHKSNSSKSAFRLTIIVDDSSTFYLDKVYVSNFKDTFILSSAWDSTYQRIVYANDTLPKAKYNITFISLMNRDFKKSFDVVEDTTLYIKRSEFKNFEPVNTLDNIVQPFSNGDTVQITYSSSGCFHNYESRIAIYRQGNNFIAEFENQSNIQSEFPRLISFKSQLGSNFADSLVKFGDLCMKGFIRQQAMQAKINEELKGAKNSIDSMRIESKMWLSTNSSKIHFNKGNKVFELSSAGINEIPYYFNFLQTIKLDN